MWILCIGSSHRTPSLRNQVCKYDIVNASLCGPANLYTCRQLLANLWACGRVLQCHFSQESINFLFPLYFSSVDPDSEFDPSQLSGGMGQVKFKVSGDKKAKAAICPIGVPHDCQQPLPYLAILMELGYKSRYKETNSKIRYMTSEPPVDSKFRNLCNVVTCWTRGWESIGVIAEFQWGYQKGLGFNF